MGCGTSQSTPNNSSSVADSYPSVRESRIDEKKKEREETDSSVAVAERQGTRTMQAGPSKESSSSVKKKAKQTTSAVDKKGIHHWLRKTNTDSTEHHKKTRTSK